jgi:SAM-dependent methyltransferase
VTDAGEAAPSGRGADLARYYDLDLADDPGDLSLYEALARRTGGPVLELAVGSGRLAVPLALSGHDVTGVDNDPHMLARAARAWDGARGKWPPEALQLIEADLTTVRLAERFGLVILALNSLLLVGDADAQARALGTMAAHLRPDGIAVVDVFLPTADDLALYDGRLLLEWVRDDPESGEEVTKIASARHDAATSTVTLTQVFEATPGGGGSVTRRTRTDRMQLLSAWELRRLATDAGLVIETLAGDHQVMPFGPGAERAVLMCRLV